MKYNLINDSLNIVAPNGEIPDVRWNKIPPKDSYGHYDLLYDEELAYSGSDSGTSGSSSGGLAGGDRDSRSRGLLGVGGMRGRDHSRSRAPTTWK